MFKDTDNEEKEISFAENYRAQILNPDDDTDDDSSRNLVIISILLVVVVALGIFGYKYLSDTNENRDVKENSIKTEEPTIEEEITPPESEMLTNINDLLLEEESNITEKNNTTDTVKIEVEEEPTQKEPKKEEEKKKTSKQKAEDTYLEQLAELSKEIDGEK